MNILRRGVWALAGLLLPAVPMSGRAASFDCAKATASHDKLICADAALSRSDEALAALYEQTRAKLSPEGKRVLLEGQRSWLRYLRASCPLEGAGATTPDEARKCLAAEYETRLKDLQDMVTQAGPYRFMQAETYGVYWPKKGDDPDDPDFDPAASGSPRSVGRVYKVPRIDDPATSASARLNALFVGRSSALKLEDDKLTDVELDFEVHYASPELLSVALNWMTYRLGAAHPNHGVNMANLLPAQGRVLAPGDLFDDKKPWGNFVAERTFAALKEDDTPGMGAKVDDVRSIATNPERWILDARGLTIHFDVYEVGSYAEGDREVTLPWDALEPYLAAQPPFPVPPQ